MEKLKTYNTKVSALIVSILAFTFIILYNITYDRTLKTLKLHLLEYYTHTKTISEKINHVLNTIENKWKSDRISIAKLQATIMKTAIESVYPKDKELSIKLVDKIAREVLKENPYMYPYLVDITSRRTIAHPIKGSFSIPDDIYKSVLKACPEGIAKYEWYLPESEEKTTKEAYIMCVNNPPWLIGSSLYKEDIENIMETFQNIMKDFIKELSRPQQGPIKLQIDSKNQNYDEGKVMYKNGIYYITAQAPLNGYFIYFFSEHDANIYAFKNFIPSFIVILLTSFFMYLILRGFYEKQKILKDIIAILPGEVSEEQSSDIMLNTIKERVRNILNSMEMKETISSIAKSISSSRSIKDSFKALMFSLKHFPEIVGIEISHIRDGKILKTLFSYGSISNFSINYEGKPKGDFNYRVTLYFNEIPPQENSIIIREILDVFINKLMDLENVYEDALTKLWNRRMLERFTEGFWKIEIPYSLILIDIDDFKKINDTYGHDKGDEVLISVARAVENSIRPSDIAMRWGGDEFVVILEKITYKITKSVIERIKRSVKNIKINSNQLAISIGAVVVSKNLSLEKAFKIADKNMYKAKKSKTKVVISKV